jgi:Glu-tRNA(Gln) amidotransferase subunit E-like FAD-binding protein
MPMKIGIEIHQRLATKKLFCGCGSELDEDE